MAAVAEVGADYHVLGLNQLHGHVLVQDVAEVLEEVVHRPDPVALEGAPDLTDVAMLLVEAHTRWPQVAGECLPQGKVTWTRLANAAAGVARAEMVLRVEKSVQVNFKSRICLNAARDGYLAVLH